MGEAVVEYDYAAQESDELTIRKGDVIREIVVKPGGWWEGTLRDKRGMFPDNFVTVIKKEKVTVRAKPNRTRQCKAVFSYHPAHDDELFLTAGDIIEVVSEVEEGWWKGRLGNHEGVFPSNFVVEMEPGKTQSKNNSKEDLTSLAGEIEIGSPSLPPKPTKITCQVKYPYEALNEDELSLKEGDIITLISKDGLDRGWWLGELRGRVGVFPDNFVVVLPIGGDQNGPHYEKSSTSKSMQSHKSLDEPGTKPLNVASQRKSLELKTEDYKVPPLPGKKPNVPKKSPSPNTTAAGSLIGLKQKMMDKVDGAASSRASIPNDEQPNDFDHVERSSMLPDMRANRARAPGRRPPSAVYREVDSNLVNGNAEHLQQVLSQSETSNDEEEGGEKKPKAREWEKHKAPWVEELKLNQAKRTSTTPPNPAGSGDSSRLKLTPTEAPETKIRTHSFHQDKESSPVDMSKSMSALSSKLRSDPPTDKCPTTGVAMRVKSVSSPPLSITPARPQSIHGVVVTNLSESKLSTSPAALNNQSPSPAAKPPVAEKVNLEAKLVTAGARSSLEKKVELVPMKLYLELLDRLTQVEQQFHDMQSTIEDIKGKLQVETDMRRLLQNKLAKVAECVTQV